MSPYALPSGIGSSEAQSCSVPDLPPPTIDKARKPVPRSMAELVFAFSKSPPQANSDYASRFGFIKKHRLNALNLELSWRYGFALPQLHLDMFLILVRQRY